MANKTCVTFAFIGLLCPINLHAMDTVIVDAIHTQDGKKLTAEEYNKEISRTAEEIDKQDQLYHRVFSKLAQGNSKLNTNLYFAAQNGLIRTATLLLERNADIQAQAVEGWVGFTPLHAATFYNRLPMISFLLSRNASLEAKAEHDLTPLHVAAFNGHTEAIKILLQHHANVDAKTSEGATPAELALVENKMEAFQLLQMTQLKKCPSCGTIARTKCSACEKVYYCNRSCQKKHWPTHKLECKK